jgi:hypothetical protein
MQRFFSGASQNRDAGFFEPQNTLGPGSAAHHAVKNGALHCVRGTPHASSFSAAIIGFGALPLPGFIRKS